jgi:hypothetical protein
MTVVQNGAKNGSKEAKPKKKKELTQDKKLTAEKTLKPILRKTAMLEHVIKTADKMKKQVETRSKETKPGNSIRRSEQNHDHIGVHIQVNVIEDEAYTSIIGCKNYEELETLADQIQLPGGGRFGFIFF